VSLPDSDDLMRGIILTLSNPKARSTFPSPPRSCCAKLRKAEEPELGVITENQRSHGEYQSSLATVLTEEFGIFAVPAAAGQRKSGTGSKPRA